MDARKVIKILENKNKITYEYTDNEGNKEKLFEIIKKYDDKNITKNIGLGNPIDLFASWMFEDGNFMTEYLVDVDFLKKDLLDSCQLELIETDTFENQYNINKKFFKDGIYKFEPNLETRDFLDKVSKYYEKSEFNDTCKVFTNLWGFSIFRKKDIGQIGGKIDLSEIKKYTVAKMDGYDNSFSLQNSIHHILQTHNIIPSSIVEDELFNDLKINMIDDYKLDNDRLKKLLNRIKIEHEIVDNKFKTVIDGIDICTFERDENNQYRSNLIKCGKDDAKIITLVKESQLYKPLYITIKEEKQAIFDQNNVLLNELIKKT